MTIFWALVAALGAVVFLVGVNSGDAAQVWSIYLVNLLFWSGLAVTGPAIAGMMQITEARWSPSVRRIALTTAGFLPISFVLLLVLYAGQTVLYPWVTNPIPAKAGWLATRNFSTSGALTSRPSSRLTRSRARQAVTSRSALSGVMSSEVATVATVPAPRAMAVKRPSSTPAMSTADSQ